MALCPILTDEDVRRLLSMQDVMRKIEDALGERSNGTLHAPPRFRVDTDHGALVFTAGAATGREKVVGFRVYGTFAREHDGQQQIVAVFDAVNGVLRGIVVGDAIGVMRTGAIGGVAIDRMSRPNARHLGVLGSGIQARAQVEAAVSVRDIDHITVYSPNPARRHQFVEDVRNRWNVNVRAVDHARACVADADIIVCATNSLTPVFAAEWIRPGTHINTLGPKGVGAHEVPLDITARSAVIATDSRDQLNAYPQPHFALGGEGADQRIVELSDLVAGNVPGRLSADDVTLFLSVGLAGTEVVIAAEALRRAAGSADVPRG